MSIANGKPELVDLGWANGWKEKPAIVKRCQEQLGHRPQEFTPDAGIPYKCFTHYVRCDICGYRYKVDSS